MADNRVEEAVNVVARWIIADRLRDVEWGDYPEIGEYDWERVIDRMDEIAGGTSVTEFEAAYEFLVAREDES